MFGVLFGTCIIFGLLATVSFGIAYFVTIIMSDEDLHSGVSSLNNVIMTQVIDIAQRVADMASDLLNEYSKKGVTLAINIGLNSSLYIMLFIMYLFLKSYSEDRESALENLDEFWRCYLHPLFHNVIFYVLQIARVIFGFFAPLYNANYLVIKQTFWGTFTMAVKCDATSIADTMRLLLNVFIAPFTAIQDWTGIADGISDQNNIITNELNITQWLMNMQMVVNKQEQTADCLCEGLSEVFDYFFIPFRQKEIAIAMNHAFNVPLSILQQAMMLLPTYGKFPLFIPTINHVNGFIFYFHLYFDKVFLKMLLKTIELFGIDFIFEGMPKEFFLTNGARFFMAGIHLIHTVFKMFIHFLIPQEHFITDSHRMMTSWKIDHTMQEINLALDGWLSNVAWVLKIFDQLKSGALKAAQYGADAPKLNLPDHVELTCDFIGMNYYDNLLCGAREIIKLPIDIIYLLHSFFVEFFWKSIVFQEENFVQMLQRYDGISFPRTEMLSCRYRANIDYDLTAGECKCDPDLGTFNAIVPSTMHPFGVVAYDPYCGQPNLQVNVFGNLDRAIAFLFSRAVEPLKDFMSGSFSLGMEAVRTIIKLALSIDVIIKGEYFHRKVNCGYGLSSQKLRELFNATSNQTTLSEKIKNRQTYKCKGSNMQTQMFPRECLSIDSVIVSDLCDLTANPVSIGQRSAMRCQGENRAGCECNFGLEMSHDNQCKCIRLFPDDAQEVAERGFTNAVLELFYKDVNAIHWCNTFWLEWLLFRIRDFAGIIDGIMGLFHPAYDDAMAAAGNKFCSRQQYTIFDTKVLRYKESEWNQDLDIFNSVGLTFTHDSCKVSGTTDFICSLGLTLREMVNLLLNEFRALSMGLVNFLDGDFYNVHVEFSERLCDFQRAVGALCSVIPGLIPNGPSGTSFQIGLSQFTFTVVSIPIIALDLVNYILVFLSELITGKLNMANGPVGVLFDFVFTVINIGLDWIRQLLISLGNLMNGIAGGSGSFLFTVSDLIRIVQTYLMNEAVAEILELVAKVAAGFLQFFTSGDVEGGIGQLFKDLWTLITKFIMLLVTNIGKVMIAILDMLGAVGSFIRNMASGICNVLESAINIVAEPNIDMGCLDSVGRRRRLRSNLFDHNNASYFNENIMFHAATKMNWNGSSSCDMFMHAYKDYSWDDLRPLEHITLIECVDQKHIMVMLQNITQLPFPDDLLYNWKRKYSMGYDLIKTGMLYLRHKMGHTTSREMMSHMRNAGVRMDLWLPLFNQLKNSVFDNFTPRNVHSFIDNMANEMEPGVANSSSAFGNVFRIYKIGGRAVDDMFKLGKEQEVHKQFKHMMSTVKSNIKERTNLFEIPQHVKHGFNSWRNTLIYPTGAAKVNARRFILKAAGVNTDMTSCEEREDTYVCLNCLVVDNWINTMVQAGVDMTRYYQFQYAGNTLPTFWEFFTNETSDAKAWRDDMAAMMEEKARQAAESFEGIDVNFEIGELETDNPGYQKLEKTRPHLRSQANASIDIFQRAREDWLWFFQYGWQPWIDQEAREDKRKSFIDVWFDFIGSEEDEYVQYFGGSAKFYLDKAVSDCPMSKMYCERDGPARRQELVSDAFKYIFYFTAGVFAAQFLFGIPLPIFLAPFMPIIWWYIYLYTIYGYTYACIPSLPVCFFDDLYAYFYDQWYIGCFCTYIPSLATSCDPETCFLCSRSTTFKVCKEEIPALNNLGLMWASLFFLRQNYPEVILFFYKQIPFSWLFRKNDDLLNMARDIVEQVDIRQVEIDCLRLAYVDIFYVFFMVYLGLQVVTIITTAGIKTFQYGSSLFMLYTSTIYSMICGLELQTTAGLKNTEIQDSL